MNVGVKTASPVLTCVPRRASFWSDQHIRASGRRRCGPLALSKAGGDMASIAGVNGMCQLFLAPQLWSQLAYICQVGLGLQLVQGYTEQYLLEATGEVPTIWRRCRPLSQTPKKPCPHLQALSPPMPPILSYCGSLFPSPLPLCCPLPDQNHPVWWSPLHCYCPPFPFLGKEPVPS